MLQKNHLTGLKRKLLRLSFHNVQQLMAVRRDVAPIIRRNANKSSTAEAYSVFDGTAKAGAPRLKVMLPSRSEACLGRGHVDIIERMSTCSRSVVCFVQAMSGNLRFILDER